MSAIAEIAVERRGDVVIASVDGEIDRSNVDEIAQALLRAVPNAAHGAVVDLSATSYIDSSGVQLLFDLASRLAKRQQQLRAVVRGGSSIARLLSVVALERTVPLHATVEDAVEHAAGPREDDSPGLSRT